MVSAHTNPDRVVALNDDLLTAVAGGDKVAFRQLYDATAPSLFPICLKIVRDRDAAREVFQDAYFRIWQKAYLYDRQKGRALAWMATITRRCALDKLAESKVTAISLGNIDDELILSATAKLGGGSEESLSLKRCLEKLDEKYSRAILLAYFYGFTHEELSSQLNIPLGTAKSWVTRGLAQLQGCMGS